MKRHVYLAMKSLEEAREIFFSQIGANPRTPAEEIPATDSLGRVTGFCVSSYPYPLRSSPMSNSIPLSLLRFMINGTQAE